MKHTCSVPPGQFSSIHSWPVENDSKDPLWSLTLPSTGTGRGGWVRGRNPDRAPSANLSSAGERKGTSSNLDKALIRAPAALTDIAFLAFYLPKGRKPQAWNCAFVSPVPHSVGSS